MVEGSGKTGARCPACGNVYDDKINSNRFTMGMVDPGDSYCEHVGYVHVHKNSRVGENYIRGD